MTTFTPGARLTNSVAIDSNQAQIEINLNFSLILYQSYLFVRWGPVNMFVKSNMIYIGVFHFRLWSVHNKMLPERKFPARIQRKDYMYASHEGGRRIEHGLHVLFQTQWH